MRFSTMLAGLVAACVTLASLPAYADSPHFIGTPTCSKSLTSGLTCSGKAAGLGNSPETAQLTASQIVANYTCVNHGGNVAPGQPQVVSGVSGPQQPIQPRNGQITFSPNLPVPPKPSAASTCPNGNWTLRLDSITFYDVVLTIADSAGNTLLTYNFGTIDP